MKGDKVDEGFVMSVDFYNKNAQVFCDSTKDVDVSSLLLHFLPLVPAGGRILDAGCGSGRDSKYFKNNGYEFVAIDESPILAEIASSYIKQEVEISTFLNYYSSHRFDGIWACASLLHIPSKDIEENISHLCSLLVKGGVFYCSFKYGSQDRQCDGRYFTDCDEERLNSFICNVNISVHKMWQSVDLRPNREKERWLNVILIKK